MKEELKQEFEEIFRILLSAQESAKIVTYLLADEEDEDIAYCKGMSSFFAYTVGLAWSDTIISLSKLFSTRRSDQYNISKFLNKLKAGGYFAAAGIDPLLIQDCEQRIDREKAVLENLLDQRDKVYVHTDRDSKEIPNLLTLTKTEELLEILRRFLREVYLVIFGASYMIADPINGPLGSLQYILHSLGRDKKRGDEERKNKYKP